MQIHDHTEHGKLNDGDLVRIRGEWGLSTDPYEPPASGKLLKLLALPFAAHPDYSPEWAL